MARGIKVVEVAIVLLDEERFLRPSLRTAIAVNRRFDGFANAYQRVNALDIEAVAQIVAAGLDKREPEDVEKIREAVFRHGVALLVEPVTRFVEILSYGGREPGSSPDEERASSKKA